MSFFGDILSEQFSPLPARLIPRLSRDYFKDSYGQIGGKEISIRRIYFNVRSV